MDFTYLAQKIKKAEFSRGTLSTPQKEGEEQFT